MQTTVAIDLDVLAISGHRAGLRAQGDWDAYHAAAIDDPPDLAMVLLAHGLARCGVAVCLITDRPERWMIPTQQWLMRHEVAAFQLDMRAADDWRSSSEIKFEMLGRIVPRPAFVVAEDPSLLEACREDGLMTLELGR